MRKWNIKQLQARELQLTKQLQKTTGAEYYKLQRRVSNIRAILFKPLISQVVYTGFAGLRESLAQFKARVNETASQLGSMGLLAKSYEEASHAK